MPSPARSNTFDLNRVDRVTIKGVKASAKSLNIASHPPLTGSNGPILDAKTGNLAEVGQVLREEQRVVRKRDGRDSRIHRAEAQLQTAQLFKSGGGGLIEVKDWAEGEIIKQRVEFGVTFDLLVEGFGPGKISQPAAKGARTSVRFTFLTRPIYRRFPSGAGRPAVHGPNACEKTKVGFP